ncbi:MAG TPA: cytochrome c biogenesis protein CcsA [Bacteroidia bacterium]|jgi:heme exporter protein C
MQKNWWKILAVVLLLYTVIAGFMMDVPRKPILHETIRNQYFHVCMWFAMLALMSVSLFYSLRYLRNNSTRDDVYAAESANVAILFGTLGLITGSVWAKFTWTEWPVWSINGWWVNDVKLNGAAICMLIYFAYMILRNSIEEEQTRARVSAVYNIFAYVLMIVFLLVVPRLTASMHPGNGGNPAFSKYDLDNRMRMVFYPAVVGWILLGVWILQLRIRIRIIQLTKSGTLYS